MSTVLLILAVVVGSAIGLYLGSAIGLCLGALAFVVARELSDMYRARNI